MYSIEYLDNGIPFILFESFILEDDIDLLLDFLHTIEIDCNNIIIQIVSISDISKKIIRFLNEVNKKIDNIYIVVDDPDEFTSLLKDYEMVGSFDIFPSLDELVFNTEIEDCFY